MRYLSHKISTTPHRMSEAERWNNILFLKHIQCQLAHRIMRGMRGHVCGPSHFWICSGRLLHGTMTETYFLNWYLYAVIMIEALYGNTKCILFCVKIWPAILTSNLRNNRRQSTKCTAVILFWPTICSNWCCQCQTITKKEACTNLFFWWITKSSRCRSHQTLLAKKVIFLSLNTLHSNPPLTSKNLLNTFSLFQH